MKCTKLPDLLKVETRIIHEHISEHKWFNGIQNEDEAIIDFINKFGWLMRELYCEYICEERENCKGKEELYFNKNEL